MKTQILIIEDDTDIREGIKILLEDEGYKVTAAADGAEGLHLLSDDVSLVILDIMMPGISGLEVCKKIREVSVIPILFLTAKSTEADKLIGLNAGGDDYLIKPFSYGELSARIKALIRRHQIYDCKPEISDTAAQWITRGNIRIHTHHNECFRGDTPVSLTETEYEILRLMMQYPSKIFSVQNLYESVWNEPFEVISSNTIMVHIRNLRKKIEEDPQHPKLLLTVWGKGYHLA